MHGIDASDEMTQQLMGGWKVFSLQKATTSTTTANKQPPQPPQRQQEKVCQQTTESFQLQ